MLNARLLNQLSSNVASGTLGFLGHLGQTSQMRLDLEGLMRSARSAYEAGDWRTAESICRQVLATDRQFLPASLLLGVMAARANQASVAIRTLRSVLAVDSTSFEAAFWLGTLLRTNGDVVAALDFARQAVELNPYDAAAAASLSSCLSLLGQTEQAIDALDRAITLDPTCAVYRHNLSLELERLGRVDAAIDSLRVSIELDSNFVNSYVTLGRLLRDLGKDKEADSCFQSANKAVPKTTEGYYNLGRSLYDEGIVDEAETCLRLATDLEPDFEPALSLLGTVLLQLGRFEEAADCLDRTISLEPLHAQPYIELIGCRKTKPEHTPLLETMAALIHSPAQSNEARRNLHYALGKAYDDLGDYRRAMRHYDEANGMMAMQLSSRRLDRNAHTASFNRMIGTFSEAFLAQRKGLGFDSEMPILIVGMIRSGTTLIEQIISSHPDVAAGGELMLLQQRYQRVIMPPPGSSPPVEAAKLATDYLDLLASVGKGKPRVTDKMPHNFLLLGLVHIMFPNALLIHCRRHPVDTCLSIYTTPFPQPLNFAHNQEDIVFFYKEYLRVMEHWRRVLPANRFLEVDYEELVMNQEAITRKMVEFCGLEWNDSCLRHEQNEGAIRTPSWWQARQPVYRSSVNRWRNYEPWLGSIRELLNP